MATGIREQFRGVSGETRPAVLMELVKVCPYEQQLHFLEQLQEYLHKDFIGLLPEQLVKKVLTYLSVGDAINCTMVCKKWKSVISACSAFWSQRARELGLSAQFISDQLKKPGCKGLKELCASAVSHQRYIRLLSPHTMLLAKSASSASLSYNYAGNAVALRYKELDGQAQVFVERIVSAHSLVEIAAFSVNSFSGRIKWAASSGNYILWKQVDGKWCGFDTTSLTSDLEQWVDEPVSQGFHSITFCHSCHLIAILSEAEDDMEVWDLQVVQLANGKSTVRKMVYPLPLERVQGSWQKKRHFLGGDVTLLSETEVKDANGFCQSHKVLLQVDSKLVLHRLTAVPAAERLLLVHHLLPDARLSKPLHVFSPAVSSEPMDFIDFQVSKGRPVFCYSQDYSRAALLHESYLYIWLLSSLKQESRVDLLHYGLPVDCKCVAVGSLYAILASDSHGTCYVVVLGNGELLMHTASSAYFNPDAQRSIRFSFYPPISQDWLNGFQYSDFWPLALVFDYFNRVENPSVEHELKALIGMPSRTAPRLSRWGRVPISVMECVGDSLPELTTELVSAYTTQSSEIRLKEDSLQRLDCELVGLRLQLQAVARDVSTTVRTICLREECLAKLGQECESLEGEVCVLVEKKQGLQLELQNVKREKETQDKIQNSYEDKIQHHENKTRELEKLSATQIELQALREKIVTLKAKREMYYSHKETGQVLSGEKQQCLQEELAAVEATRTALQQDNTLLEQKLDKTQEMIKSLKKDMEMGKKRQVAQLKCLQRLLNEAQAERRRWAKKAEGLRANIRQIKQRIEE